jgi:hypothetical protein
VLNTCQGCPPLLFISPQTNRAVGNLTGRISGTTDASVAYPTDAAPASVAPCDATYLARSTFQQSTPPATDVSHAEATSVYHCDRRGTESSKPRSRPTHASDRRPTDAVMRLSQRKAARLLNARSTGADVSVYRANARASVAPLHIISHRTARVRRQTLHSRVCHVRRARLSRVSQCKLVPQLRHFFQPSA